MKSTIIYLGVLATMFVNTTVAKEIAKDDQNQNFDQATTESILESEVTTFETTLKKPEVNSESDVNYTDLVMNTANNNSSPEAIIEEDKKITEFNDEYMYPLILDRTMEEVIQEDNQIIESTRTNEVYPLDFELIRQYENALKVEAFKNTAFDKTNLKS